MIQFLRGTSTAVSNENPVLAAGQPFFETDTNKIKIGNGVNQYNSLPYINPDVTQSAVDWSSITGKPSEFPPEAHTHTTSQITDLNLSEITTDIDNLQHNEANIIQTTGETVDRVNTLELQMSNKANTNHTHTSSQITDLGSSFMNKPTNTGSSNQWLKRSSSNQGTWSTLPTASASQAGMMPATLFSTLKDTYEIIDAGGTDGANGGWIHLSNNIVIEWQSIYVYDVSVNTALGDWYRSNAPYLQTDYPWQGINSVGYPMIQMNFVSTNNAAALIWINPTISYLPDYVPQCYLIRPVTGTCTGYISVFAIGYNNYL